MAARRLILVMLVLLVLSSIAAALVPVERDRLRSQESMSTATAEPAPPTGKLRHARISAGTVSRKRIELSVGDQLALTVTSQRPDLVEIPAFGELENVDPELPARFNLLALEPGRHAVRLVEAERTIAKIDVSRSAEKDQRRSGGSSKDSPGASTTGSTSGANSAS